MYGLLTKCEVKMAGYWPSSFFACLWTETRQDKTRQDKTTLFYQGSPISCKAGILRGPGFNKIYIYTFTIKLETESRSINSQKKERGQFPAILTKQTWSIKDLLHGFRGTFSCGTRRVVPSGQDSSILPARVANHRAGFDSSCPLTELAI